MSEYNKGRYYWIKLTDRFMTSDTVDFLMEQPNGAKYVVLYQMLCLKAVNNNGELSRKLGEIIIPFDENKIQRDTKWFDIDTIRVAMQLYKQLGLIYEQENGILKISNFDRLIGSQTESAEKKQMQREKRLLITAQTESGQVGGQKVENCPPEKDIRDKDIESITNIYNVGQPDGKYSFLSEIKEIIDYLNAKLGTNYKHSSKQNQSHIKARLNEGFTVDDFKKVIDKKSAEWLGTDMAKFLRPETLFSTKFESYLNELTGSKGQAKPQSGGMFGNIGAINYDGDD